MGELPKDSILVSMPLKFLARASSPQENPAKNILPYEAYLAAVNLHYRRPSSIPASKIPHLTENCDWFRVKV